MADLSKVQYDNLLDSMRELKDMVTDTNESLAKDREAIQDMKVFNKTLEEEVRQLRRTVNDMDARVKDRVADAVAPLHRDMDRLKKMVEKKKFISFKKPGFFSRLLGRGGDKE